MFRKIFFSAAPFALNQGVCLLRIIVGLLITYHGLEVFNAALMKEYISWDAFSGPNASTLVYAGKATELLAGILLLLGLGTRFAALMTIGVMSYVTFFVGGGRFWYQDQHPFMFVLFGLLFLFTGPGTWCLDSCLQPKKNSGMGM